MNNITAWTGLTLNFILRKTSKEVNGELSSGVRSTLGSRKIERRSKCPSETVHSPVDKHV